jgi:hypothetical protein
VQVRYQLPAASFQLPAFSRGNEDTSESESWWLEAGGWQLVASS